MLRFIILFVALVAGGGAAWIALAMRTEVPAPVVAVNAVPAATGEVLVAAIDLVPGRVLGQDSFRWQAWTDAAAQPSHITRAARPDAMQSLAGAVVRATVARGEPIREDKLAIPNAGLLSSMLRPGKRAVAVRITAENTAGGFVMPNDRVDVLHTIGGSDKAQGPRDFTTTTILTNISVLAVDQTLDEADKRGESKAKLVALGKTATLELDPQQAELLTTAQASGTLSLTLRATADNAEAAPVPRRVVVPRSEQAVVIVRGGSSSTTATTPPKAP
jgi:pilus assembly protein CpaB